MYPKHAQARKIVETILGRKLKAPEEVHHFDENKQNNNRDNLVVCPSREYHALLHIRTKALEESGKVFYRKCRYCGKHDDPKNMLGAYHPIHAPNTRYEHMKCASEYYKSKKLKPT